TAIARATSRALSQLACRHLRGSPIRRAGRSPRDEPALLATAARDGEAMDERVDGHLTGNDLEEALAALLYDDGARARLRAGQARDPRFAALDADELEEAARAVRRMVHGRAHRGTGGLEAWFPRTLAAWRAAHSEDAELDELLTRFCSS